MRFNPTKNCSIYHEWPNPWELKPWFRRPKKRRRIRKVRKEWEEEDNTGKQILIPYWRDLQKINQKITDEDLKFRRWPRHRRKPCLETVLPPHLCHGLRFIKITMGFPLGWTYSDMPMNLTEIREVNRLEVEQRKIEQALKKQQKKAEKAAKKAEKAAAKAAKGKGKGKEKEKK